MAYRLVPVWILSTCLLLWGCGIEELFRSVGPNEVPIPAGNPDAGLDAGLYLPDGATRYLPDGALRGGGDGDGDTNGGHGDGDGDSVLPDGGTLPDGAVPDGGQVVMPIEGCTIDEDAVWKQTVPFDDEGGHALAPGGTGFGIAYRLDEGCDAVEASSLASRGPFPHAIPVLGQDACAVFRDLDMLRVGDEWLLSWVDNSAGSAELFHRRFTADMGSAGELTRVTDNEVGEMKPALARIANTPVLAWIEGNDAARALKTRVLDTAEVTEVLPDDAGHLPVKLALAPMGGEIDAGAIAWVNEEGDRGIWLQALDGAARPVGEPTELTDFASAGSTVDLATRTRGAGRGGAAVYSVIVEHINREVRFRRLDTDGSPIESERVVVGRPLRAQDASISQAGDGYVVAYRALPDGLTVTEPEIRLLFVTREGTVERDPFGRALTYKVAAATATQGRTTVRVSVEGQLLISWLDFSPQTGENTLKMTRRRLDCAP